MNRENQQERLLAHNADKNIGWYISGFVDGEGSFNISLRRKKDYKIGWQPVLSFNVSQKDKTMLEIILNRFRGGIIKQRRDGLYSYDATNPEFLAETIIPFFEEFSFFSKTKRLNFSLFKQAVQLMLNKQHLKIEGFKQLLEIREKINQGKGRKRKYQKKDVLEESSETTC